MDKDTKFTLRAVDQISGTIDKIRSKIPQLSGSIAQANTKLGAFSNFKYQLSSLVHSQSWEKLGTSFKNVQSSAANLTQSVTALTRNFMLYGGIATAAVGSVVYKTVEASSKLVDLSNATGANIESIQTLGYAFGQAGGSTEEFQTSLLKFSKNIGDVRRQTGPLYNMLKKSNKPLLSNLLKTSDTGQAMRLYLASVSNAKTETERLSLATVAFGKTGRMAWGSLLKEGPESIKKLEGEMPGLISDDQARTAEAFGDTISTLQKHLWGMTVPIVSALIPSLDSLAKKFTDFLKDNQQNLKNWASDFGEKLPGRIESIIDSLKSFWNSLAPLRKLITWIVSDTQNLKIIFQVLAGLIMSKVLIAMAALSTSLLKLGYYLAANVIPVIKVLLSVFRLLAATILTVVRVLVVSIAKGIGSVLVALGQLTVALVASPLFWVAMAIAAVVAAYKIWTNWERVKNFMGGVWDGFKTGLETSINWVNNFLGKPDLIQSAWASVKTFFVEMWSSIKTNAVQFLDFTILKFQTGASMVQSAWTSVKNLFLNIWDDAKASLDNFLSSVEKLINYLPFIQGGNFSFNGPSATGSSSDPATKFDRESVYGPSLTQGLMQKPQAINQTTNAKVIIDFKNLPQGTSVRPEGDAGSMNLNLGYAGVA